MKRTIIFAAALLFLCASWPAHAQNPPAHAALSFYHLKFAVEEAGATGQVTNSRVYQTIVATDSSSHSIKTGSRIPIATGSYPGGSSQAMQFQYIDLGIDFTIDRVELHGDRLSFHLMSTVSSTAPHPEVIEGVQEPVIRQNVWSSEILVTLNKPTVVFSSDELDSKGKMEIEVTATPVQ